MSYNNQVRLIFFMLFFILFSLSCKKEKNEITIKHGEFVDNRDGKSYKTVTINGKVWMAENLAYYTNEGCWAYDDDESNVAEYGRLYNFDAASQACPSGWRLPSIDEYDQIFNISSNNEDYVNAFNPLGGGIRSSDNYYGTNYRYLSDAGYFGTSASNNSNSWVCVYRYGFSGFNYQDLSTGVSIRCIKDETDSDDSDNSDDSDDNSNEINLSNFSGNWSGNDGYETNYMYYSQVKTKLESGVLKISGLNVDFMEKAWGETIVDNVFVTIILNPDKTITIPEQYFLTTSYDGENFDYKILGSGEWDIELDNSTSFEIQYYMFNQSYSTNEAAYNVSQWMVNNGYGSNNFFSAHLTLDSSKKIKVKQKTTSNNKINRK